MGMVDKQNKFSRMVALLILHAQELGYQVTLGDAYRPPDANYGHPKSNHKKRLAIDLNLFLDGKYITDGQGHDELHDYWDTIGGSERIERDMNHYSVLHKGIR